MSMDKVRHTRLRQLIIRPPGANEVEHCARGLVPAGRASHELLAPWPLKLIFDQVLMASRLGRHGRISARCSSGGRYPAVAILSASVFLMVVVGGAFSYGQVYLVTKSGYQLAAKLKTQLFSHLQEDSRLSFTPKRRQAIS